MIVNHIHNMDIVRNAFNVREKHQQMYNILVDIYTQSYPNCCYYCWILLCSEFPGANTMRIPHLSQFPTCCRLSDFLIHAHHTKTSTIHLLIYLYFPFTSNLESEKRQRGRGQRDGENEMGLKWNEIQTVNVGLFDECECKLEIHWKIIGKRKRISFAMNAQFSNAI